MICLSASLGLAVSVTVLVVFFVAALIADPVLVGEKVAQAERAVVVAQVPDQVITGGDGAGVLELLAQPRGGLDMRRVGDGCSPGPDPGVFGHAGLGTDPDAVQISGHVDHPPDQGRVDGVVVGVQTLLPFHAYLALTGALRWRTTVRGFGTNSTPNHLLLVGGQSPTMRDPPRTSPPVRDMPSVPGLADDSGVSWRCYTASGGYPVSFFTQLQGSANVVATFDFVIDAAAGTLPALSYVWHASPADSTRPRM